MTSSSWQSGGKIFVELHQADNRPCMVDLTSVTIIGQEDVGERTTLFFDGGHYQEVQESYEVVIALLRKHAVAWGPQ